MEETRLAPKQCYVKNKVEILIVGVDEENPDIYYISMQIRSHGDMLQCPFVPIQKNVLENWTKDAEMFGYASPASVEYSKFLWQTICKNVKKTSFDIDPEMIMGALISGVENSDKTIEDFRYDEGVILLPTIFPVHESDMP